MKKNILSLLLIVCFNITYGQVDKEDIIILLKAIREPKEQGKKKYLK